MAPFWDYFDEHFKKMREEMEKMLEEMTKEFEKFNDEDFIKSLPEGKTLFFGMDAVIGPDGVPHIRTFRRGNWDEVPFDPFGVLPTIGGGVIEEAPLPGGDQSAPRTESGWIEPFTDVMTHPDTGEMTITLEMPGIDKKDVKLKAGTDYLSIEAKGNKKKYRKLIKLQTPIDKKSVKASYRNGVLELRLKLKKGKDEETEIKIE